MQLVLKHVQLTFKKLAQSWFGYSLILVLLIALTIRVYKLGEIPVGLYWDEVAMLVDVKALLSTGADMHGRSFWQTMFISYGDFKLPVYIWLATASSWIFGATELSVRLPSMVAGMLTIIVAPLIVLELYGSSSDKKQLQLSKLPEQSKLIMIATMVVVGFSPWSIMFSRTGFEGHVGQLFLAISIYAALKARHNYWWFLIAAVLGILSVYTYYSIRFVWPVVFMASLAFSSISDMSVIGRSYLIKKKFFLLTALLSLCIFFVGLIPMIQGDFYQQSNQFRLSTKSILQNNDRPLMANMYRLLAGNARIDRVFFNNEVLLVQDLAKNYAQHLSFTTLFLKGDANLRHSTTQHGLFLLALLPQLLFGLYWWGKKNWYALTLLLIWWLAALLPASVPLETPHALRSINAMVPVSILIAGGVVWTIELAKRKNAVYQLLLGGWVLALVLCLTQFLHFYFTIYPQYSAQAWQGGYKQLAKLTYETRNASERVVIIPFDQRFYLWLLAFGPYTGQEYTEWQTKNFEFLNFDQIINDPNLFDMVWKDEKDTVLLVGEEKAVDEQINSENLPVKMSRLQTKSIEVGDKRYQVVRVELQ